MCVVPKSLFLVKMVLDLDFFSGVWVFYMKGVLVSFVC